ncbi:hypothetical protein OAF98_04290 [Planctomicrobium sp.]|nr:hypothetical protein [Planctomicrobium sp.]MDB4743684.1 hypothetical protein [Planctomicrobium sp.]
MLKALLNDEAGFIVSTELVLVATILVIGLVVGQTTLRDNVVTELADTADAISAIDQSYSWSNVTGHSSSTSGSLFVDAVDFCDGGNDGTQGNAVSLLNTCVVIDTGAETAGTDSTEVDNTSN